MDRTRGMAHGGLLAVAAALVALGWSSCPGAKTPLHWAISCKPGQDEYAVMCVATARAAPFRFTLGTDGDSHFYLSVDGPECARRSQSAEQIWDRLDWVGMPRAERRRVTEAALSEAAKDIGRACPGFHLPKDLDFGSAPDVGTFSELKPPYGPAP